jgi:hypothetical protein
MQKKRRMEITSRIVMKLKQQGLRFVDAKDFTELSDSKARDKVSHALRCSLKSPSKESKECIKCRKTTFSMTAAETNSHNHLTATQVALSHNKSTKNPSLDPSNATRVTWSSLSSVATTYNEEIAGDEEYKNYAKERHAYTRNEGPEHEFVWPVDITNFATLADALDFHLVSRFADPFNVVFEDCFSDVFPF